MPWRKRAVSEACGCEEMGEREPWRSGGRPGELRFAAGYGGGWVSVPEVVPPVLCTAVLVVGCGRLF